MAGVALTIGNFDGVHIGHVELVHQARRAVGPDGQVVALTFDPHPSTVLRPSAAPERLTTFEHRAELLREAGADRVELLTPDRETLGQSPQDFVGSIVQRLHPVAIVEGEDFRFGKARAGDGDMLTRLGKERGFAVTIVKPVAVDLDDQTIVAASSTRVRWLLTHGRVSDAWRLLGRPYQIRGTVTQGDRRGRTIGIPTANIATEQHLPMDGVYRGVADAGPAGRFHAAISIGLRPTFGGMARRMEVHLIDAPRQDVCVQGLPEYGWPIRVDFTGWVRDDMRFPGIEAITAQIHRDIARIRAAGATIQNA